MHPLTEKLLSAQLEYPIASIDKIVMEWMNEKSNKLKKVFNEHNLVNNTVPTFHGIEFCHYIDEILGIKL